MRILVVGAGAIGGYFGGRLLQAGRDVTFLVRPGRAAQLAQAGLVIRSPYGDAALPAPPTLLADDIKGAFDLILLSCKAYDLDGAMTSFAPAVGPRTAILPLLNGMAHLDILSDRFGGDRVLGGQCLIAATLDETHAVVHLNRDHDLTFGERDKGMSDRLQAIATEMDGAVFVPHVSTAITQDMWEKWVFLASLAGSTCLMRAAIGDIVQAPGGRDITLGLLEECRAIAEANGHAPRAPFLDRARAALTTPGSPLTASMLRDIERGGRIEADHIVGDLVRRAGKAAMPSSRITLLAVVRAHLGAYEARQEFAG